MDTNPSVPVNAEVNTAPTPIATPQNPVVVNTNPPKKKMGLNKKWILITLVLISLVVIIGAGGFFFLNQNKSQDSITSVSPTPDPNEQTVCTQDVKECPDGSFVSRQGPQCAFAECPTGTASSSADSSDWKTFTSTKGNYSIKYPDGWSINDQSYNVSGNKFIGFTINGPMRSDIPEAQEKNSFYIRALKFDLNLNKLVANEAFGSTGEQFQFQGQPGDQAPNSVSAPQTYITNSEEHKISEQILSTFVKN